MTCDCSSSTCNIKELPLITGGFLNLTQKCNLKCKYCFVVQQPFEMTYQVAKDAIDFYAKNAAITGDVPSATYFGGEPLLRWDDIIVPLTKYIREKYGSNYRLSLTTNGILLDKEKLDFMKKHNIGFLFSMDGAKTTQDRNRPFHDGRGSFDKLINKIPMILEYNPNATFRSTIDHDGVSEVLENYQFAISQGYNNVFMIPNVFVEWSESERKELKRQIGLVADIFMDNIRIGKHIRFSGFDEAFDKIKKINIAARNSEHRDAARNVPAFGRCGLGGTKFASIGASGTIFSCQELSENPELGEKFAIGNIYDGVDDEKRWEIMKDFDPKKVVRSDGKSCDDCLMNGICNGACTINNYLSTGDLNTMPDILCEYYQIALDEAIRIMNTMADEENIFFKNLMKGRL